MKKSLKVYLEQHAPRKNASKMLPYYSEMLSMREQGYSYGQLSEALQENDVKAHPSEIKRFMDRRVKHKSPENRKAIVVDGDQLDYKDEFFKKFK